MALLIRNGDVVTAGSRFTADILCEDERISAIGQNLQAPAGAELIDATGKLVFPGFIDPHAHIYLPFMGTFCKDDFETATIAALCGGTTTLFDFAIPGSDQSFVEGLQTWLAQAEGKACSDYAMHLAVTRFDEKSAAELREIVKMGVPSWKVFLAYKGAFAVDDEALYKILEMAKQLGVRVGAHCENAEFVAQNQAKFMAEGKTGPEWHEPSRPAEVETLGTRYFSTFARMLGTPAYVVHVSNGDAMLEIDKARELGADIVGETLISYLLLDDSYGQRPDFEGAKYICSPPIRDKSHQERLWEGLRNGRLRTLGSDHAPFDMEQKRMGLGDFTKIPNGLPGLEDRVRLYYTHGVQAGRIDLQTFVATASTNAAKIFGLFPQKGTIAVGSDADLVIYDPSVKEKISVKTHHMNVDYSAFEGFEVTGRCAVVTVRGKVQVRDGEFVGEKGMGKFLKRERLY